MGNDTMVVDDREWYMLRGPERYKRLFFDRLLPLTLIIAVPLLIILLIAFQNLIVDLLYMLSEPFYRLLQVKL